MITTAILNIIYYVIYLLASPLMLLNDVVINTDFSNSLNTAISYAQAINSFFPVYELIFTITSVFLLYEGGYFLLKLINWVLRKIPGIS